MEYPPRYERSLKYKDIKNENVASLTEKAKIIFFRSVGFDDWFVGLKGYSKFEPKPFWKKKLVREKAVEVARLGNGLLIQIKMRDYIDRGVIPPKRVTSPTEVLHLPVNRRNYCQLRQQEE